MKYTQPLFIQGILPLKGLYDSKILLIHILGRKTEGELKRPFVAPAGFMGAPAAEPVTEEPVAAVEAKKDK